MIPVQIELTDAEEVEIFNLWNKVYPAPVTYNNQDDFKAYLARAINPIHLVIKNEQQELLGWLMTFTRNEARNFVMLINPAEQGSGRGRSLIAAMKELEAEVFGYVVADDRYLKLDQSIYQSPLKFYEKLGFLITNEKLETPNFSALQIHWAK